MIEDLEDLPPEEILKRLDDFETKGFDFFV